MAEEYITLSEAAELEGIQYSTMARRTQRNPEAYKIKNEKSDIGGRNIVLVAVSSLSKPARNAWKRRMELAAYTEMGGEEETGTPGQEAPWYVTADLDWYIDNYKKQYYKGVELGNVVRKFLQYTDRDRTRYAEEFAQKYLGKGARTLYRYVKAYQEACAWAERMEKRDGVGYDYIKVLSLCRKPKESGQFPGIPPAVKQVIKNIWFNKDFARNQGTRELLYQKLSDIAALNGWEKLPSYPTVARYISYLMNDEGMRNAWLLASKGVRAYKNEAMMKGSRDTRSLRVMEVLMGDVHTFDCWVSYRLPNGREIAIRPHLIAWIDVRSRMIFGDLMCRNANADTLKLSVLKTVYSDPGGVPRFYSIDNGKDFTAKEMTGRNRKDRGGLAFDDELVGFYKSVGVEDVHRALPYQPWVKGQIERFFGKVCTEFTKQMASYVGTLTGSKTDAKIDKDIKGMLERGELLTLEEFFEEWSKWLDKYHRTQSDVLKKAGETYTTPLSCYENEERYFKAAPPRSYATMLMLKSDNVRVYNVGIKRFGREYRADELCDYIGQKVSIKYDPSDVSTIYVFDRNGKRICEAHSQELLPMWAEGQAEQELLESHLRDQNRQLKVDRERLKEATAPFEGTGNAGTGVVGGIDLMIGKKTQKGNKVVSLPNDRTYQQGFRAEEREESDYIRKKGESALKKLKAIGQ